MLSHHAWAIEVDLFLTLHLFPSFCTLFDHFQLAHHPSYHFPFSSVGLSHELLVRSQQLGSGCRGTLTKRSVKDDCPIYYNQCSRVVEV